MSITLTSDPIVSEQMVRDLMPQWNNANEIRLAINSVSARFKLYTGRKAILSATVTEWQRGRGLDYLWLHATPLTSITSVELYSGGAVSDTIASGDYSYNATTGRLYLHGSIAQYTEGEENVKVVYVGGWAAASVPGDLMQSALELMKLDKARLEGRIGVRSEGREGFSASYDPDDLPASIVQVWKRYRFSA
ncbi:MAG TPA: hypothetical protein VM487_14045 [Phycisphaerae bacterium]|nr:hypothetical protein [Phycisphaerae bacterium]